MIKNTEKQRNLSYLCAFKFTFSAISDLFIWTNAIRTKVILPVPREILKSKDERVFKKSIQNFKFLKVFSISIVIFKIGFMTKTTITRHFQTLVYTMNTLRGITITWQHDNLSRL